MTFQPTREKILDEVFKLVYIHGYNGTSMSMILMACEIPKGSLYHFFTSKKEMVLAVLRERIAPRMDAFYHFEAREGQHAIDTVIDAVLKVVQKEELVRYGCPLNRLNQEMSPVDSDFEAAIHTIYKQIKHKIVLLLKKSTLQEGVDAESLAEYIIASVWGSLSLSPVQSSKERYLSSVTHLINYLQTLKK
jgi:TetR/AcrR family transcriptional repressor of nem operon